MPVKRPQPKSALEETFALHCRAIHLPEPVREFRFHPERMWRADFAWPDAKLLVECDGGAHGQGRHTRGASFEADLEKLNTATLMGYAVLRYTGKTIKDGTAVDQVQQFLAARVALNDLLGAVP